MLHRMHRAPALVCVGIMLIGCTRDAHPSVRTPVAIAVAGGGGATPTASMSPASRPAGPSPLPTGFDAIALTAQVTPTVVNITTTHEVQLPAFEDEGFDPFEFFFGP